MCFICLQTRPYISEANADELATEQQNFYTNFRLRYSRVFTQNLFIFEISTPVASRLGPVHAELMQLSQRPTDKTSIQIVRESEATTTNRLFVYGIHEFLPQNFSCSRPTTTARSSSGALRELDLTFEGNCRRNEGLVVVGFLSFQPSGTPQIGSRQLRVRPVNISFIAWPELN